MAQTPAQKGLGTIINTARCERGYLPAASSQLFKLLVLTWVILSEVDEGSLCWRLLPSQFCWQKGNNEQLEGITLTGVFHLQANSSMMSAYNLFDITMLALVYNVDLG